MTETPRKKRKMSSSTPEGSPVEKLTAAVLTVSDSSARGERADLSGPAVAEILKKRNFAVVATEIVADDQAAIQEAIIRLAGKARLVVTTGGTGIAERDVTPEATRAICDRLLEGVAERMRFEGLQEDPAGCPQPRNLRRAGKSIDSEPARQSARRV